MLSEVAAEDLVSNFFFFNFKYPEPPGVLSLESLFEKEKKIFFF